MADESADTKTTVVPPYPLALVVCDQIYQDSTSQKFSILGTFSMITSSGFPAQHGYLAVYFALTDGHGRIPLRFRVQDAEERRSPVVDTTQSILFSDPKAVVEGRMDMANLHFPEPGEYRLQMLAGTELLMERKILLVQLPEVKK